MTSEEEHILGLQSEIWYSREGPLYCRETAVVLTVSTSTLSKWRATRQGPQYFQLGGVIRYRIEDLAKFVLSICQPPRVS